MSPYLKMKVDYLRNKWELTMRDVANAKKAEDAAFEEYQAACNEYDAEREAKVDDYGPELAGDR